MTQALNFTTKAIECFASGDFPNAPLARAGINYLAAKLRQAEVFILPEYGAILDRDRPRPEVPGLTFNPAFPVVALEYVAPADRSRTTPGYTDAPSSRRIALAWRWTNDLPRELSRWSPKAMEDGVVVASICFMDNLQRWLPVAGAAHFAFDSEWTQPAAMPFMEAARAAGQVSAKVQAARTYPYSLVPLLPEALNDAARRLGMDRLVDSIGADLNDEINAYLDLCYALSCRNVSPDRHAAPAGLNRARIRKGKLPLKDFHILKLTGADASGGGEGAGDGSSRRAHMRRGHIRQLRYLGEGRMTWVNATMVGGRGFVDKAYAL